MWSSFDSCISSAKLGLAGVDHVVCILGLGDKLLLVFMVMLVVLFAVWPYVPAVVEVRRSCLL